MERATATPCTLLYIYLSYHHPSSVDILPYFAYFGNDYYVSSQSLVFHFASVGLLFWFLTDVPDIQVSVDPDLQLS